MKRLAATCLGVCVAALACLAQVASQAASQTGAVSGSSAASVSGPGELARCDADRDVPHGKVVRREYESTLLHATRHVLIYTPPGYDADPRARFPVLYLLAGQDNDETGWIDRGRANTILDNLIADGLVRPMIVVMPQPRVPSATSLSTADAMARNTEAFARELLGEIVPNIDRVCRTVPDRDHRAIVGCGLGGQEALVIGLQKIGAFGYVAAFNASVSGVDFRKTFESLARDAKAPENAIHMLSIYCSREDRSFVANSVLNDYLTQQKITHDFQPLDDRPNWRQSRDCLKQALPAMFAAKP